MENFTFIDRYFHSQKELVDIRQYEQRDINSLFSYLNNLHSLSDKFREHFNITLSNYPEFKILRILRNFFHHVGDIDEKRMFVNLQQDVSVYHLEQIIIPLRIWAESINNFVDKNTLPRTDKRFKNKQKYVNKEFDSILDICDCVDIIRNPKLFCKPLLLKCDGVVVELGFDIFKFVYNISNIIADECRKIPVLAQKKVILALDESYNISNNIPKHDLSIHAGANCILTTEGYIFPSSIGK